MSASDIPPNLTDEDSQQVRDLCRIISDLRAEVATITRAAEYWKKCHDDEKAAHLKDVQHGERALSKALGRDVYLPMIDPMAAKIPVEETPEETEAIEAALARVRELGGAPPSRRYLLNLVRTMPAWLRPGLADREPT